MSESIAIIGAGIIGISTAVQLQRDGHRVTVIDRAQPMEACSAGNAGHLSEANIFPPASRDMIFQLPKLLLSSDGPLVIRPAYLPSMVSWGARALSSGRQRTQRIVMDTLASMTVNAYTTLEGLAKHVGASSMLSRDGSLYVYKSHDALEAKSLLIPEWSRYNLKVRRLSADEVLAMEPALSPEIAGGIFFENSGRCSNPKRLGQVYAQHFTQNGGRIILDEVRAVLPLAERRIRVSGAQNNGLYDRVVVCGGFWSAPLLAPFCKNIPLVSERGYHLMLPTPGVALSRPVIFGEPLFAATPMEEGLRLAGTAEFADPDSPPDMRRAAMLLKLAQRYLSEIEGKDAKPWMGIRPSFPDGLPAIGSFPEAPGLYYAFGHAHNGLTLSAVTAQYIAALVRNEGVPIDLPRLSLARFQHS